MGVGGGSKREREDAREMGGKPDKRDAPEAKRRMCQKW